MSRLSRDKTRDQQRGTTPIDVRVPLTGECATVAGTPVTAPPGEELHQAVLTHLHHLARTTGHPVHATIHDARIGYVVPLEVATDGSSRFTAEPVRMAPPEEAGPLRPLDEPSQAPAPALRPRNPPEQRPTDAEPSPTRVLRHLPGPQPAGPAPAQAPGTVVPPTGEFGPPPVMGASPTPTPVPTALLSPADLAPTAGPLSPADLAYTERPPSPADFPHTERPLSPADLAHTPRPLPPTGPAPMPAPPRIAPAGIPVQPPKPPTGHVPDSAPHTASDPVPGPEPRHLPSAGFAAVPPQPLPSASPAPRPAAPLIDPVPLLDDPGREPTPVRGFDAVAEAVLGEGLVVDESAVLAEPVGRISEAVREGRADAAAELAERVVAEASETLGAEHPDVLRVRELAAYIAYLGGEPVQAAEISLDLADIHHRAGDAEAAYGNVQSAATAWKAVRDPLRGLALGRDLLTLWTELAAGEGPAAEDPDKLESARSRMVRLAERAQNADH